MTLLRQEETTTDGGSCFSADPGEPRPVLKILLADDEAINQKVAVRVLRGMGHEVSVVADGRGVVEAWESGHFDLILMDVQMPGMDGFEALAEVRGREAARQDSDPVPILALTAHSLMGDRERCLAAGFDDHLSKSLDPEELGRVFEKWSKPARRSSGPTSGPTGEGLPESFDVGAALANLGGDEDLFREILALFLDDCPKLMAELEIAVDQPDGSTMKRLAHTIRGVAGHFCLTGTIAEAAALEGFAKLGDWPRARRSFLALRLELDRVIPTLQGVLSTTSSHGERNKDDVRNGTVDAVNR